MYPKWLISLGFEWWVLTGSNRRPTPCKGLENPYAPTTYESDQLLGLVDQELGVDFTPAAALQFAPKSQPQRKASAAFHG